MQYANMTWIILHPIVALLIALAGWPFAQLCEDLINAPFGKETARGFEYDDE